MESLAYLVGGIFLGSIVMSLATVGFALTFRLSGRFRKTSLILWSLQIVLGLFALSLGPAFGAIPGIAGLAATVLIFFRKR